MEWSFKRQWRIDIKMWSTKTVVTDDWSAIWSTVTYHNQVWRTQQWYQNGWSQDVESPDDETLLFMPTMWIHLEVNTAALVLMVIWRQTHLAVWLCTPLLSSPLLYPMHLSTFCLSLFSVTKLRLLSELPTFQRSGGRMFCHNAGNHEQPYIALHPRPNKHH
jgi:hypothetical protein